MSASFDPPWTVLLSREGGGVGGRRVRPNIIICIVGFFFFLCSVVSAWPLQPKFVLILCFFTQGCCVTHAALLFVGTHFAGLVSLHSYIQADETEKVLGFPL